MEKQKTEQFPKPFVVEDCSITFRQKEYPIGSVVRMTDAERDDVDPNHEILKHEAVVKAEAAAADFKKKVLAEAEAKIAAVTSEVDEAIAEVVAGAEESNEAPESLLAKAKSALFGKPAKVQDTSKLEKQLAEAGDELKLVLDENTKLAAEVQALKKDLAASKKPAEKTTQS